MREIKKKFKKLWCGCGKTVKALVWVQQNWAETQFCCNMEKNYTARRPAICLHAVIFWDFLSCGEACKSSRKFKKSTKMVTSANCGADSKDLKEIQNEARKEVSKWQPNFQVFELLVCEIEAFEFLCFVFNKDDKWRDPKKNPILI